MLKAASLLSHYFLLFFFFRSAELVVINYCGELKNYLVRFVYMETFAACIFKYCKLQEII